MIELLLQAERALSVGLLDRAETLYKQVANADPRNSIAVVGMARVTLDRGDELGALDLARRALAIDGENVAAQRMIARLEEVIDYRAEAGRGRRPRRARGRRPRSAGLPRRPRWRPSLGLNSRPSLGLNSRPSLGLNSRPSLGLNSRPRPSRRPSQSQSQSQSQRRASQSQRAVERSEPGTARPERLLRRR